MLDNIQGRFGAGGVTLAANYHAARDIYPHNPKRKLADVAAAHYYQPGRRSYGGAAPCGSEASDLLGELCAAAAPRGIETSAWAVVLHDDAAGSGHPSSQVDCWGGRPPGLLCPANPGARRQAIDLVEDLSSYPVATVRAESLRFHGIAHGGHHERVLERYGALTRWLFGVCFCEHCMLAAADKGIDASQARRRARAWLDASLSSYTSEPPISVSAVEALLGDDMAAYCQTRMDTVTSLAGECAAVAAAKGRRFCFIDDTLAGVPPDSGDPPLAVERGWEVGVDVAALDAVGATPEVTAYRAALADLGSEIDGYRRALQGGTGLAAAVLRVGHPDSDSGTSLLAKARALAEAGFSEINFYVYGLYRLETMDAIRAVVEAELWKEIANDEGCTNDEG